MYYTTVISATQLARIQTDAIIVDCRHDLNHPDAGRNAYHSAHIPGARFVHLDDDLSGPQQAPDGRFKGRHPLPEHAVLMATLRRLGINDATQVIAYDAHGGMFAARLWWLLRQVGHAAVAVLDGGLAAWPGMLTDQATATCQPGTLTARPALNGIVNAADLLRDLSATDPAYRIVDARAPDRFRGENETLDPVGGHIPGAKNRFFKDNLQADGHFKAAAVLRAEWLDVIDTPAQAVMQCGSGVTACHNLLALEIAGLSGAALYPGSWSEWCADPTRPVAQTV